MRPSCPEQGEAGKSFNRVQTANTAGPDCKFAPGCQNISTQSLAIFQRLGEARTRIIAVDERMGIVWLRMAWDVRERGGDQLTVWESFKVYDGRIHAVEAFMRILPFDKRNGGWQ